MVKLGIFSSMCEWTTNELKLPALKNTRLQPEKNANAKLPYFEQHKQPLS